MNEFEKSLLKYFTPGQLLKIQQKHIGVAGAGGLGSNCAWNLVRCGFNKFTICDFDTIEFANLNRQFYFFDQVGLSKVEALKANLLRINPDVKIEVYKERISGQNVEKMFKSCDIVVEAFDKAVDKKMLAEKFAYSGKFYVSASGLAGWGNSNAIIAKKINKTFSFVGDSVTEVSEKFPPCSPRVNVAAAKEADCVLEWVLSDDK